MVFFVGDPGKIFREIVGNENLSFKFLGKMQVRRVQSYFVMVS